MLTLFPFEAQFYEAHRVPVEFVGHPLADMIPMEVDSLAIRKKLALPEEQKVFALLPGSRLSEINAIGMTMVEAAVLIQKRYADAYFVVPLASSITRHAFETICNNSGIDTKHFRIIDGQARDVMAAADVVMVASGTATLEAMLLKRPMVVTYRLAPLTYWLAKRLIKTPYVSLPNLLVGRKVVEELIQDEATPERLAAEVLKFIEQDESRQSMVDLFNTVHRQLRQNASSKAADALLKLLDHPSNVESA